MNPTCDIHIQKCHTFFQNFGEGKANMITRTQSKTRIINIVYAQMHKQQHFHFHELKMITLRWKSESLAWTNSMCIFASIQLYHVCTHFELSPNRHTILYKKIRREYQDILGRQTKKINAHEKPHRLVTRYASPKKTRI